MRNRGHRYVVRAARRIAPGGLGSWLASRYGHTDAAEWRRRIARGRVRLDGRRIEPDAAVPAGSVVTWDRPPWDEPDAPDGFRVVHVASEVLVVDKPSGLPTLPGAGFLENTLAARVAAAFPGATPSHRLGRYTSGLVVFARGDDGRRALARAFRERRVRRRYRAWASGNPRRDRFTIDAPIGPVPHDVLGTVHGANPDGREALSTVAVVERRADGFLADVTIETGRPHQVRIHLAAAGHPLVGDPLYEAGGRPKAATRALPGDPGYALHATVLAIPPGAELAAIAAYGAPPAPLRRASRTAGQPVNL